MNKMYFWRELTSATIGLGNVAVIDCYDVTPVTQQLGLLVDDQEKVGVHKADLKIRVSATGEVFNGFAAVLIQYITDGTVTDYTPGAVSSLGMFKFLMQGFQATGDIGWKILDRRISAPVKAGITAASIHEVTFMVDIKETMKKFTDLVEDPNTDEALLAGFAVVVYGTNTQTAYVGSSMFLEYSVHDRPMRSLVRANY